MLQGKKNRSARKEGGREREGKGEREIIFRALYGEVNTQKTRIFVFIQDNDIKEGKAIEKNKRKEENKKKEKNKRKEREKEREIKEERWRCKEEKK